MLTLSSWRATGRSRTVFRRFSGLPMFSIRTPKRSLPEPGGGDTHASTPRGIGRPGARSAGSPSPPDAQPFPRPSDELVRRRLPEKHPRLMIRPEEVPMLRQARLGAQKARWDELVRAAEEYLKTPLIARTAPVDGRQVERGGVAAQFHPGIQGRRDQPDAGLLLPALRRPSLRRRRTEVAAAHRLLESGGQHEHGRERRSRHADPAHRLTGV